VKVLVVGSGAREHAIVRGLLRDPDVEAVHAAPGNAGIAEHVSVHAVDVNDGAAVAALARRLAVELVVVGPEAPLVAGVADAVRAVGIACFGPSEQAARLEGSKAFAKQVMAAAGVPTARSRLCESPAQVAAALDEFGPPYVVKDDGLAAGKGVVVTGDRDVALAHARTCGPVLVEEYLDGPEVSLFVVCDGSGDGASARPLLPAQDFKRIGDADTGPNTGGMGAYAPLPWAPANLTEQVMAQVVRPTLARMAELGAPFAGLLYVGLALTSAGPKVVEFNVRFGDPETEVVLELLATPLGGLLFAAATGALAQHPPLVWRDACAVTVVLACEAYPSAPVIGDPIDGLPAADALEGVAVLHAGTAADADGHVCSCGGRVLAVTATADDLGQARDRAYRALALLHMRGGQYRHDIAEAAAAGRLAAGTILA
jgi:phosphoribosylamine--glycine ligase